MTLSDFRNEPLPVDNVEAATFVRPGYPSITLIAFSTCCAPYPGGIDSGALPVIPLRCCLPRLNGGSASTTLLSRPAQASLALRPAELLARLTRTLSWGFSVTPLPLLISYLNPAFLRAGSSPAGYQRRW